LKTFIANFGRENYEWPVCLARGTVATMNEVNAQALWEAGDRESYVRERMKGKTAAGIAPTRPVASRWFNLMTIISETAGDLWIHRAQSQLWWTISRPDPPTFTPKVEPIGDKRNVIVCHKPCEPWSNSNRMGNRLEWSGLHPKAREFLATESTLGQLSEDNANYAHALINGDDLGPWHIRQRWKEKLLTSRKGGLVTVFSPKQRAAVRMAETAGATAAGANGQQVLKTIKNKEVRFASQAALERYVLQLIELQDGLCAITGLALQYDGDDDDVEMLCSLDRIDSDGHYEEGNLQIVCRFANRWKSSSDDATFRRLIDAVRSGAAL
jgi:hypothetical protein